MFGGIKRLSRFMGKASPIDEYWSACRVVNQRVSACLHSRVSAPVQKESAGLKHSSTPCNSREAVSLSSQADHGAPYVLSAEQVAYVTKGDPSLKFQLDTLLMELFVKRQKGIDLPQQILLDEIVTLMGSSSGQSNKILHRLHIREIQRNKQKQKKQIKQEELEIFRQERETLNSTLEYPWLRYRLFGNALFPRIYTRSESHFYNLRLEHGRKFGQNVVFDCSFNKNMRDYDIKNAAKQLILSLQKIKENRRPFGVTFCNIDKDDRMFYYLKLAHPQIDVEIPVSFVETNYTNIFPKNDIVYLSPHCRYDLEYSPHHVYIIGALVDKVDPTHHSVAKAREDGVRMARLPIDKYMNWQQGSKSLCINQVIGILLSIKNTGCWKTAFNENLPSRKVTVHKLKNRDFHLRN